ncbi:MAG: sugar ABC transporter permease [Clostridiales bacterium]|nr:sugar ABC transporter permease [Clostridiales bacterium]
MRIKYATKRRLNGIIFILPWLIGFIFFFIIPIINTVIYSFNNVSVRETGGMELQASGFQNYINLFKLEVTTQNQPILRLLIEENQKILVNVPLIVIFSLFLALIINAKFKGRAIVRVIFFLPIILGLDIVSSMLFINNTGLDSASVEAMQSVTAFTNTSISDILLKYAGLPIEIAQFIQDALKNISMIISKSGVQVLIFLAGLQSISPSLYEVARIEGATEYETFWKVTIPATANITFFVSIYTLIDMFLNSPITKEIYNFAFLKSKIGVGSALSVLFVLNEIVFLFLISLFLKKVVKLDYGKY